MTLSTKTVAMLLLLSSVLAASSQARVLLADTTVLGQPINWPISSGSVREANMDQGVPAGRNCVATGMHCSNDSQCCSKGCDLAFFRCG